MGDPDRSVLEDFWRRRLIDAKLRLDFARTYVKEIQRDFSSGELPSPDGHYAFEKALRLESLALIEYTRVLRLLTDVTVHGKLPNENDWPQHKTASDGE